MLVIFNKALHHDNDEVKMPSFIVKSLLLRYTMASILFTKKNLELLNDHSNMGTQTGQFLNRKTLQVITAA